MSENERGAAHIDGESNSILLRCVSEVDYARIRYRITSSILSFMMRLGINAKVGGLKKDQLVNVRLEFEMLLSSFRRRFIAIMDCPY